MSPVDTSRDIPVGVKPHEQASAALELLRAGLARGRSDQKFECLLTKVADGVNRLAVEHAGMAEELLCVYEQIGIVFEVTRRLPTVHAEADVIELFVDSLRRSFQGRAVSAVGPGSVPKGKLEGAHDIPDDWLTTVIGRARDQASVVVESPPPGAMPELVAEVLVGPVFAGESFVCAIVVTRGPAVEAFRSVDMLLFESLTLFCGDLIRNHRLVREMEEMSIAMVRSLVNAVDQKDTYTSGHSVRVGYFATLLGRDLALGDATLQMLEWSALLHDVGKIGIRDDVLKKRGKLTEEEFNHIKEHPVRSHRVVQQVPRLAGALDGVLYHHERYDGSGYPSGLSGAGIPLQARIILVADVFDALTSDRAYRPAYDWPTALDVMAKEAGTTIDPELQERFDRLIREKIENDPDGWEKMTAWAGLSKQVSMV